MTTKNRVGLETKTRYLDIYTLHLVGLDVEEIMSVMGCSQRTVYHGLRYGAAHTRELIGDCRLEALIAAKQHAASKARSELERLWSGNKTIVERKIVGFRRWFGGYPPYQKKVTVKPSLTFRGAIKRFGRLHALESTCTTLQKLLGKE